MSLRSSASCSAGQTLSAFFPQCRLLDHVAEHKKVRTPLLVLLFLSAIQTMLACTKSGLEGDQYVLSVDLYSRKP